MSDLHIKLCTVVRPTWKVNGKEQTLTPVTSKSWKFFKFEHDVRNYVHEIYTSANSHFNPFSGGFSPDRCEILQFCDFFQIGWLYCIFLRHAPRSNLWMDFHSLWLIRCLFAQGWSFWGLWQYQNSFAVISQKIPQNGAWKFQAKWAKYKNRGILQSINTSNV